jgi:hypothetical protein
MLPLGGGDYEVRRRYGIPLGPSQLLLGRITAAVPPTAFGIRAAAGVASTGVECGISA